MLNALSRNWWATVLRGLLAIGVGILAWSRPEIFWASLVLVFGVYAIVDGVFAIVAAITGETRDRAFHLLEGLLGIVVGVIVFLYPDQAGTAIVLVIGLWAAATGVVEIVSAVRLRREIEDEWLLGSERRTFRHPGSDSDRAPAIRTGHDDLRARHVRIDLWRRPRRLGLRLRRLKPETPATG